MSGFASTVKEHMAEDCAYHLVCNDIINMKYNSRDKIIEFYSILLDINPDALFLQKDHEVSEESSSRDLVVVKAKVFVSGTGVKCDNSRLATFFGFTTMPTIEAFMNNAKRSPEQVIELQQKAVAIKSMGKKISHSIKGTLVLVADRTKGGKIVSFTQDYHVSSFSESSADEF